MDWMPIMSRPEDRSEPITLPLHWAATIVVVFSFAVANVAVWLAGG